MRSLLIVLCSLSMAAMEQDMVCDYQGVAPTSLPHPCKHRIEPAVLQDHTKLTGIKRKAEACGIEPRKKIKHQQINTIGVKRAATNELGGPRKKQQLSHIGMLPWHEQKLKAAHAYITIKENKPIAYLKNLENRFELLRLLGATLPGQTLMVPIHVESLKRSCLVKNARHNNEYSIGSPYDTKKITHLPADFVSNLQEGVAFDVYLHTTGLRANTISLTLLPAQTQSGYSTLRFEDIYLHKVVSFQNQLSAMTIDSDEVEIPDITVMNLSASLRGSKAHD